MRKRSLRSWLTFSFIVVIVTPILAYIGAIMLVRGPGKAQPTPWAAKSEAALDAAVQLINAHPGDWGDTAFRARLQALQQEGGFAATLVGGSGRVVYSTDPYGHAVPQDVPAMADDPVWRWGNHTKQMGNAHMGLVQDAEGRVTGIYLLEPQQLDPWVLLFFAVGIGCLVAAAAWGVQWIYRAVNQPVQALAGAASLINAGRLDFELPESRVRELNELAEAFAAMREGLQHSIEAQAEMEEERRFFVSAIAHDLRTPLTSVRGYLEGIRDGVAATPERIQQYLAVALAKTGQLERLVQDLFVYAKTEYLSQPPTVEPLPLDALLGAAVEALRPRAEGAGLVLTLEGSASPALVAGDRLMLTRVVDNLLDNAFRHTPAGGSVTVGWEGTANGCRFWVQDSGPGIPAVDLPFLFQPLYRGDKARSSRSGGAGLGLAIARRLVEAHGGRITAANVGGGARFTITLPQPQSNP